MTRRPVYAILFLFALLFPLLAFTAPPPDLTGFAIMGDTKVGHAEEVYTAFVGRLDRDKVPVLVVVGDAIDTPGSEAEWRRFLELSGNGRTVHIAPGNHDVDTQNSLLVYSRVTGRPAYYSAEYGDTLLIFLNTELPGQTSRITGRQLEWLKSELMRPFKYHFVFLHRPVFSTALGRGYGLDRFPEDRDRLYQVLREHRVPLVVAGHEHLYDRREVDGTVYVITGGGGSRLIAFTEELGGFYHYVLAKRTNGMYVFRVFDRKGNVRDEFSIKR